MQNISENKSDGAAKVAESKHTPGPWIAGEFANIENELPNSLAVLPARNAVKGMRSAAICLVAPTEKMNSTDVANAELIAAAPELLSLVKKLGQIIDNIATQTSSIPAFLAILQECEAAIAKAEGHNA